VSQPSISTVGTLCGAMKDLVRKESVNIMFLGDISQFPVLNILLWSTCVTENQYQELQAVHKSQSSPSPKTVYPPADFSASQQLQQELKVQNALQRFLETKSCSPFIFLLPEQGEPRLNFTLHYTIIPELFVRFKTESEMSSAEQEEFHSLRGFWGKSLFFKGNGKSIQADRIFIQQRLHQVIIGYRKLVHQCAIGFPCAALLVPASMKNAAKCDK